jgi:hypothetical protein
MKNTCEARFLGRHIVCTRNSKNHVIPYRGNWIWVTIYFYWEHLIQSVYIIPNPGNMILHSVNMILQIVMLSSVFSNEITAVFRSYNNVEYAVNNHIFLSFQQCDKIRQQWKHKYRQVIFFSIIVLIKFSCSKSLRCYTGAFDMRDSFCTDTNNDLQYVVRQHDLLNIKLSFVCLISFYGMLLGFNNLFFILLFLYFFNTYNLL